MTATATETTPGSRTSPPKLPVELQGRIIRHALLVPSGAPLPLDADTPYSIEWDQYAGDIGREARSRLAVQRAQATREALNLMRMVAEQCLYTSPQLRADNLFGFTRAVMAGMGKWWSTHQHLGTADIYVHSHPEASPGCYVKTLDLSSLMCTSIHTPSEWDLTAALSELLEFVPNVTRMIRAPYLDPHNAVDAWFMGHPPDVPCSSTLLHLEDIQVAPERQNLGDDWTSARLAEFLRSSRQIEVLSMSDLPGERDWRLLDPYEGVEEPAGCHLEHLHTLSLHGASRGPASELLLFSSLPRLTRLAVCPDRGVKPHRPREGADHFTGGFQAKHGRHLRSLTFLPFNAWQPWTVSPHLNTLSLHPELAQLSYLLDDMAPLVKILLGASADHPLEALTITKRAWANATNIMSPAQRDLSEASSGHSTREQRQVDLGSFPSFEQMRGSIPDDIDNIGVPAINRILSVLETRHLRNLRIVTVDGYHWPSPQVGQHALESRDTGRFHTLACQLRAAGRELRDGLGKPMPEWLDPASPTSAEQAGP